MLKGLNDNSTFTHLSVNQAHDSRLHPHADGEASVHVLMIKKRLEAGQQEHQSGIEVAFPLRSFGIPYETQKKAGRRWEEGC